MSFPKRGKLKTFIKLIQLNYNVPIIHTSSYSNKNTVYKKNENRMIVNFHKKLSHASPSLALCLTSITWNVICSRVTSHTIIAKHT